MSTRGSGDRRSNPSRSIGLTGQIFKFNFKDDDFSACIEIFEIFELFVLLNEINAHKKKLMFLTLLGNDGYSLIRDLCIPSKPTDKSYEQLEDLL